VSRSKCSRSHHKRRLSTASQLYVSSRLAMQKANCSDSDFIASCLPLKPNPDAPTCRNGQRFVYAVGRNEQVEVLCEVDAQPTDVQFRWSLNSSALGAPTSLTSCANSAGPCLATHNHPSTSGHDSFAFSANQTRAVARFQPRNRFGYGALACWAQNSVGVQHQPCIFNIVPSGTFVPFTTFELPSTHTRFTFDLLSAPPEPPRKCELRKQSINSLFVQCSPGESPLLAASQANLSSKFPSLHAQPTHFVEPSQKFHLEVYDKSTRKLHANYSVSVRPTFLIEHLPTGELSLNRPCPETKLIRTFFGSPLPMANRQTYR
jgi:hypothetical protein